MSERQTGLRVLIVDDERNIRATLEVCLQAMGCKVVAVGTVEAAVLAAEREAFELAFVDLRLGQADGMQLLPRLLSARPALAIVVITAYATFDTAVKAIQLGAADYLPKPFTPEQIQHRVDRVAAQLTLTRRVADLETTLAQELPGSDLETASPRVRAALDILTRAAASNAPVLLRGESGTGKGLLARALHARSPRARAPFVTVNCPTLSEELLTSELFGHIKGAFTGAVRDQAGRVESAEGGTLFLDEIGEISPSLQSKLLRFVQEHQFERVGEGKTRHADVRLVAATHRNLEEDVKAGRFREDLLYRLNVVEVEVPPLRERPEDVVRLARRFLTFFAAAAGRTGLELAPEVEAALLAYPWPGNVRELRNTLERAVLLWPGRLLTPEALPERVARRASRVPVLGGAFPLEEIEREHITRVLATSPTLDEAARTLGIDASTLWRKRRKYEG